MLQLVKKFLQHDYHYLNKVELYQDNLTSNLDYLKSLNLKLQIAPVLKSNAYGHGLIEIGKIIDPLNVPFICVDSLHEAYRLYKAKIKTKILIMGYFDPKNLKIKKLPFAYSLFDLKTAEIINSYQKGAEIHIKVDTGMHRMGIPINQLEKFITKLKEFSDLKIVGIMSHLAVADDSNNPLFKLQVKNFKKAIAILESQGLNPKYIHLSASNGILDPKVREIISQFTNLVRAGKALYGLSTHPDPYLKPVLQLTSKLAQIKLLEKGDRVGYDGTFNASKDLTMGILPIGYNDGVDRRLSNIGFVKINGVECKILGRVSMNITTVDISKVTDPKVGQEVIIYSQDPEDKNSVENSAKLVDTIAHELLVHIEPSTKRIII